MNETHDFAVCKQYIDNNNNYDNSKFNTEHLTYVKHFLTIAEHRYHERQ